MLVALAAKCLAGLATGLRKKFGQYAGHVSKSMYFFSVFIDAGHLFPPPPPPPFPCQTLVFIKGILSTIMNAYLPLNGASSELSAKISCSLRLNGPCLFKFSNTKLTIAINLLY